MPTKDPYPEIGRLLTAAATVPWERIVLEAEVGDDWGSFSATSFLAGNTLESLRVRPSTYLLKLLQEVRRITSRDVAPGAEVWNTLVFTLRRDGRFEVEFGY